MKISLIAESFDKEIKKYCEEQNLSLSVIQPNQARKNFLEKAKIALIQDQEINHELIESFEDQPDLIIKQGADLSLQNSLIVGASYGEIYFTHKDFFSLEDFQIALEDFKSRQRNFGV